MVAVVVQHQFDDAGAVIEIRSHRLAYLRWAVRVEVLVLPERALLRRNAVRLAAERRDDLAAGNDRRALVPPRIDAPPHVVHGVVTGITDIAHRREAGGEHAGRVVQAAQRPIGRALEDVERLEGCWPTYAFGQRQVSVRI